MAISKFNWNKTPFRENLPARALSSVETRTGGFLEIPVSKCSEIAGLGEKIFFLKSY